MKGKIDMKEQGRHGSDGPSQESGWSIDPGTGRSVFIVPEGCEVALNQDGNPVGAKPKSREDAIEIQ